MSTAFFVYLVENIELIKLIRDSATFYSVAFKVQRNLDCSDTASCSENKGLYSLLITQFNI